MGSTTNINHANVSPRRLSYMLIKKMTKDFDDELELGSGTYGKVYLGEYPDGRKVAVKVLHDTEVNDHGKFDKEFLNISEIQHPNDVQLVSYCHETTKETRLVEGRRVLSYVTKRALCFEFMKYGSLEKHLFDVSTGHGWRIRFAIIKGICNGLKHLHEELEHPIFHLDLKPGNILLDEHMTPKIADFGLSRLFGQGKSQITISPLGTPGYVPPEYIDEQKISNKFDIYSLGVVIIQIIAGHTGHEECVDTSAEEFAGTVLVDWRNRLQQETSGELLESYCEQVKRCIEIALQCIDADRHKRSTIGDIVKMLNETEAFEDDQGPLIDQMSSSWFLGTELIDVHPTQLNFSFQPNKIMTCPLHVTNNTDEHPVAVRCVPKFPEAEKFYANLSNDGQLSGVILPRSVQTFVLTMKAQRQPPENMDLLTIVVESHLKRHVSISDHGFNTQDKSIGFVTVRAVCSTTTSRTRTSEPIRPAVKIILGQHEVFGPLCSMDVHPTEPWILVGYATGFVIWNCETQIRVNQMEMKTGLRHSLRNLGNPAVVHSITFVVRKQIFVVGDEDGYIHVYTYMPMKKVKEFKAHAERVKSLAVHPTQPFVLSASRDKLIKLWNWEQRWACTRTFSGHSDWVNQVKFNPQYLNTFASVSDDGTLKIWDILSPNPVTSLDCKQGELVCFDYFPTDGDQQNYVVTGSKDKTASIWDLKTWTCIRTIRGIPGPSSEPGGIAVINNSLQEGPVMVMSTADDAISIHDSTNSRNSKTVQFGLGWLQSFAYIKAIRSLAIAHSNGIAIMEID